MSMLCKLGFHQWGGCKCRRCGLWRNEGHRWVGCQCKICGNTRDESHAWEGCMCKCCGKVRNEEHDWQAEFQYTGPPHAQDKVPTGKNICRRCGKRAWPGM